MLRDESRDDIDREWLIAIIQWAASTGHDIAVVVEGVTSELLEQRNNPDT